jgi:hypothetical protein
MDAYVSFRVVRHMHGPGLTKTKPSRGSTVISEDTKWISTDSGVPVRYATPGCRFRSRRSHSVSDIPHGGRSHRIDGCSLNFGSERVPGVAGIHTNTTVSVSGTRDPVSED